MCLLPKLSLCDLHGSYVDSSMMADLVVGTIQVYLPHTDEFVPEKCCIMNSLAYLPAVY